MHDNNNDDFSSIIHSCPTTRYIISTDFIVSSHVGWSGDMRKCGKVEDAQYS